MAAREMRRVLVDHARARNREKRLTACREWRAAKRIW